MLMSSEKINQYPALNVIVVLARIIARIFIVISLLGILGGLILIFTTYSMNKFAGFALLLSGFIGAVCGFFLLAYAESIKVIVDIEANTRRSTEALALIAKGGYNTQKG